MRRRGYTPEAIRNLCERIGVGKKESLVDYGDARILCEGRPEQAGPRVMGVQTIEVVIDNYPEGKGEYLDAINNPGRPREQGNARSLSR